MDRAEALSVLGLPPSAQGPDIRRAYKRLALAHHPDRIAHRREKRLQRRREEQRQPPRAEEDEDDPGDARRGPSPPADMFHRVQLAFEALQCGVGKHQDDKAHSLFKVGNGGQSVSSVSADASTVAQNMGLGDEELVRPVIPSVDVSTALPNQPASARRSRSTNSAQSQRRSRSREPKLATSWFTVEASQSSFAWAQRLSPWAQKDGLCSWMDA